MDGCDHGEGGVEVTVDFVPYKFVCMRSHLLQRCAELGFDRCSHLRRRHGRHLVVQQRQLLTDRLWHKIASCANELPRLQM